MTVPEAGDAAEDRRPVLVTVLDAWLEESSGGIVVSCLWLMRMEPPWAKWDISFITRGPRDHRGREVKIKMHPHTCVQVGVHLYCHTFTQIVFIA